MTKLDPESGEKRDPYPAQCDEANPAEHLCCHDCKFQVGNHTCRQATECMQGLAQNY